MNQQYFSTAETLYNEDGLTEDQLAFLARSKAVEVDKDVISQVEYTIYVFEDGSKLVLGNNGYIGGEWREQ